MPEETNNSDNIPSLVGSSDPKTTGEDSMEPVNYVSIETDADKTKRKNMYYSNAFTGFVWMLFHFTVVFFFGLELKSVALVWVFLALGNFISLALDVPVGILVKYFGEKKLMIAGTLSQLIAGLIFMKFIYVSAFFTPESGSSVTTLLGSFLDSGVNIFLLLFASFCYGFTKEVNDITTFSYIMNNADPSEYSAIISRNNIFMGVGSMVGLIASGAILALNATIAVIVLNVFILLLIVFVLKFFDNGTNSINFSDIQRLKVIVEKDGIGKIKDFAIGYVSKTDFASVAKNTKFLFLRPATRRTDFSIKKVAEETKKELISIREVLLSIPYHLGLFWLMAVVLVFGFWDTFATSFLIDFLAKVSRPDLAYLMLGIMAIPAYVMQEPFIALSRKIWTFSVVIIGLVLSGSSLFIMSFVEHPFLVILCGIVNSFGFAAGMGMAQGGFLDLYNKVYAKKLSLTEIDSNASASPMKMLQNFANVLGLVLGGVLLAVFDFHGFFAVFGIAILAGAVASFLYKGLIKDV